MSNFQNIVVLFCILGAFILGILFSYVWYGYKYRKKVAGYIIFTLSEDSERIKTIFKLDSDLDELEQMQYVILKIDNQLKS